MHRVGHVAGLIAYRALKFIQESYVHRICSNQEGSFLQGTEILPSKAAETEVGP